MASVTLEALRARVRTRADMVGSTFVTDAELDVFINAAADALYDILVTNFEDDFFTEWRFVTGEAGDTLPTPLNYVLLASGEASVTLPGDFYKVLGVELKDGDTWGRLRKFGLSERTRLLNAVDARPLSTRYRLQGKEVRLLPVPPDGLEGNVLYIPTRTQLVATTDTLDGTNGWEEYVVVLAAIKCVGKEEGDASLLLAELQALEKRIQAASQNRDPSEPERVVDVEADDGEDWP